MKEDRFNTRRVVLSALFAALAFAATLVLHIKVNFLTFDSKDAVICFSGMVLGPGWAVLIAAAVSLVEMLTVSETGLIGFVMNFVSSAAFAVTASLFYRRFRKLWSAIAALGLAVVVQTAVMMIMNLLLTPVYTGMSVAAVAGLIPGLLLPFNCLKSLLNASLCMLIYKPLSTALKRVGMIPDQGKDSASSPSRRRLRSVAVVISAIAVAALSIALMILVMKGKFSWS